MCWEYTATHHRRCSHQDLIALIKAGLGEPPPLVVVLVCEELEFNNLSPIFSL